MARLLNSNDSVSRCLNCIRRHQRLTKQVVNDIQLIKQVQTEYDTLNEKVKLLAEKEVTRENAYDDLILADRNLDDALRTVFEKCKQYDRDHISEKVLKTTFPDETFGDIVRLPFAKEITEVEKTAVRIENPGSGGIKTADSVMKYERLVLGFFSGMQVRIIKPGKRTQDIVQKEKTVGQSNGPPVRCISP